MPFRVSGIQKTLDSGFRDCVAITIFVIPSSIRRINSSRARRRACPVLDTGESSIFSKFWMPAFAGMTILKLFSPIATQSLRRNDAEVDNYKTVNNPFLKVFSSGIRRTPRIALRFNLYPSAFSLRPRHAPGFASAFSLFFSLYLNFKLLRLFFLFFIMRIAQ